MERNEITLTNEQTRMTPAVRAAGKFARLSPVLSRWSSLDCNTVVFGARFRAPSEKGSGASLSSRRARATSSAFPRLNWRAEERAHNGDP